jgi:phage/plasmid-associated DNA primase
LNQKYSPARPVDIAAFDPSRRYDLDAILSVLSIGGVLDSVQAARAEPLPAVVQAGSRNSVLFREGCRLRRLGWNPREIADALELLNGARCRPPLEIEEVRVIAEGCGRYEAAEDTFALSDTGNAEYFAAALGDCVRHDHGRRSWFVFREHHWWQDRTCEVDRLALETVRGRQRAAVGRESALKWAATSESCKRREDLVRLASKIEGLAVAGDQWDQNPWLLGVRNGVLDLRTGALREGDPADNLTKVAPVAFDERAKCSRWERFLEEVFEGKPEIALYMQRVIGYSLTGSTDEQVFWILFGTGSNGKSTLM